MQAEKIDIAKTVKGKLLQFKSNLNNGKCHYKNDKGNYIQKLLTVGQKLYRSSYVQASEDYRKNDNETQKKIEQRFAAELQANCFKGKKLTDGQILFRKSYLQYSKDISKEQSRTADTLSLSQHGHTCPNRTAYMPKKNGMPTVT